MQHLRGYARKHGINFVVPGQKAVLVGGITNACREFIVLRFDPNAYCSQLEGSKTGTKEIMRAAGLPTADSVVFTDHDAAAEYVKAYGALIW